MKQLLFPVTLCLILGHAGAQDAPATPALVQGLDIAAERAQIAQEKKAAEDVYQSAVKRCFQKVAVNACKQEAQQIKQQQFNELRRREIVLNDAERKERSAQALKNTQDKQSEEQQLQDAERRRDAQEQHLDKLQSNIEKNEERLKKDADIQANRDARAKRMDELLERQRAHDAKLKDAAKAKENHQRKLEEHQQHRAQVERDRANRDPSVSPLPPRTDTQP